MRTFLTRFPVQVALVALAVYLVTLSLGVTANSVALAAKVAGWDWQPMIGHPVLWLVTLPLRLLPGAWVAVGLNVFSAIGAALTLGLLVRSLELLPWYPWEMLNGWKQHVPAILAAVVCGLEFTFWQDATAATGEMLAVLLLAAAGWCALEFGVNRNIGWLYAAALIWGMGMAENWVMILTFPFFIAGLIWMRRLRFFQVGFLLKIAGFGLAGLLVYAVQPIANGFWSGTPLTPGQAWSSFLSRNQGAASRHTSHLVGTAADRRDGGAFLSASGDGLYGAFTERRFTEQIRTGAVADLDLPRFAHGIVIDRRLAGI